MIIGNRLRELRESKNMSQSDIEKRTGLFRSYVSRVENGYTVPVIETLEIGESDRKLLLHMARKMAKGKAA